MMTTGTIDGFCDELLKDDCPEARLEPEGLAEDFSRYFGVRLHLSVDDIAVLLENAGIGVVFGGRLAQGLRGVHYILPDGRYAIEYLESQWEGGKVHTILHETYEIVHEEVWHRRHGSPFCRRVCPEADRFAAAVMMPPDTFEAYALASGLDVLALQRVFRCAYYSVTRRLGEVMRRQPLMAVLYEHKGDRPEEWPEQADPGEFRATAVVRTPGFEESLSPLLCGDRGRMPLPYRRPSPGSLAEQVILDGEAEYAEVVPGHDESGRGGLAVAAKPVVWSGRLAKVAVVAVRHDDRSVLLPQLQRRDTRSSTGRIRTIPAYSAP